MKEIKNTGFNKKPNFEMSEEGIAFAKRIINNKLIKEEEVELENGYINVLDVNNEVLINVKKNKACIDFPANKYKIK